MSKRASYREGVRWIARNDNAGTEDRVEDVSYYVSTLLLADLFGKEPEVVGADVMRERARYLDEIKAECAAKAATSEGGRA